MAENINPSVFSELGVTGLKYSEGTVQEEFLPQLAGNKATKVYREMMDNSPVVGAILFAVPQHDLCWADEIAAWRYYDAWDQVQFGLCFGERPRSVVTTTPKPVKIVKELLADPTVAVTKGTTYDNLANLAPSFIRQVMGKYEGTLLGRQKLRGELLEDVEGSLWTRKNIDDNRF